MSAYVVAAGSVVAITEVGAAAWFGASGDGGRALRDLGIAATAVAVAAVARRRSLPGPDVVIANSVAVWLDDQQSANRRVEDLMHDADAQSRPALFVPGQQWSIVVTRLTGEEVVRERRCGNRITAEHARDNVVAALRSLGSLEVTDQECGVIVRVAAQR